MPTEDPLEEFVRGMRESWKRFAAETQKIVEDAAHMAKMATEAVKSAAAESATERPQEEATFTDEQWLELAIHELKIENGALRKGYRELADEFETRERLATAKQEEVPAYLGTRAAAYRTVRLIVLDKLDQLTNFPSTGVQDGDDAV